MDEFEINPALDEALIGLGYWWDEAESTDECLGYSQFAEYNKDDGALGDHVYSFIVLDANGMQAYVEGNKFYRLPAGDFHGVTCDGNDHLSVSTDTLDPEIVKAAIQKLWDACGEAFDTIWATEGNDG